MGNVDGKPYSCKRPPRAGEAGSAGALPAGGFRSEGICRGTEGMPECPFTRMTSSMKILQASFLAVATLCAAGAQSGTDIAVPGVASKPEKKAEQELQQALPKIDAGLEAATGKADPGATGGAATEAKSGEQTSARGSAAQPASPAQKALQRIITRQQLALAKASEDNPRFDEEQFKREMQDICYAYDDYLKRYPDVAAGYAAYGYLLTKLDMRKQAAAILLKANKLDANLPLVKNQLGNLLAEEGKPLEAVNYYLAAIKLDPKEPLYHYQLGTLLTEAREDFLKSGEWPRSALDKAMHEAFRQAATLAPHRIEFTYRYAECFYDLEHPDWEAALKAWGGLEGQLQPGVEQETARLHAANILIKQNRLEHARAMLALVSAEALLKQKEKLVAQLEEKQKK